MRVDGYPCPHGSGAQPAPGPAHDERFAALYAELHRLASRQRRRVAEDALLGTTTLVHETYLGIARRTDLDFPDRAHFLAYVARAMRGVVIDHLRARGAAKRGAADITVLDAAVAEQVQAPELPGRIGEMLDELALLEPALAHVVDLRFFCGFSMPEIARELGVSERTAQRHWARARALLFAQLRS